ncbi:MAG: TRAP transporter small permease subunit [Burkholderiaceae bacterium]|nr:TRAP transporter small permease subunit [Burkholderiaceae bacterium]
MPALTFILPHWLYWSGLVLFPLAAMWLVRRQQRLRPRPRPRLFLAYLFWACSGFIGLHRFYLKNLWGFVFIPVFLAILYGNSHIRDERENVSRTRADVEHVVPAFDRMKKQAEREPGSVDAARLEQAQRDAQRASAAHDAAAADLAWWQRATTITAALLAVMLVGDALLMPSLVRRRGAIEAAQRAPSSPVGAVDAGIAASAALASAAPVEPAPPVPGAGTLEDPTLGMYLPYTRWIDTINAYVGEYVSYWALLAVFVYYYEVVARYVFNSPTNWVHESMFLMFGMQYVLSGAYGYRDDSHVRVDILYARLSPRGRAACDVLTSVFFFIFTITMLFTGWRFAMDSIGFGEVSFTEWGIQYWPVKLMLPLGALLIVLQGGARLARDIALLFGRGAPAVVVRGA